MCQDIAGKLLDGLGAHMRSQGSDLLSSYSNMTKELNRSPRNIEVSFTLACIRGMFACLYYIAAGSCGLASVHGTRPEHTGQAQRRRFVLQQVFRRVCSLSHRAAEGLRSFV